MSSESSAKTASRTFFSPEIPQKTHQGFLKEILSWDSSETTTRIPSGVPYKIPPEVPSKITPEILSGIVFEIHQGVFFFGMPHSF